MYNIKKEMKISLLKTIKFEVFMLLCGAAVHYAVHYAVHCAVRYAKRMEMHLTGEVA